MTSTIYIFKGLEQLRTFIYSAEQVTTLESSSLSEVFGLLFSSEQHEIKENLDEYFGSWSDYHNSQRTFCLLYDFDFKKILVFTEITHKVISENRIYDHESRLEAAESILNNSSQSDGIMIAELWNVCRNPRVPHSKGLFSQLLYPAIETHIFQDKNVGQIRLLCYPVLGEKVYGPLGFVGTGFMDNEGYISMIKYKV
jgi:hypothetical protein